MSDLPDQAGPGVVRVAHVITDLQVGGEATVLAWLLPALAELGIVSKVIVLTANAHDMADRETLVMRQLRQAGIPVVEVGATHFAKPAAGLRLVQELRRFKPAVVHTYLFHAGMVSRPLARLCTGSRTVSSVVGMDLLRGRTSTAAEYLSLRLAHRILVNAHAIEAKLRAQRSLRSRVVLQYNGVDIARIVAAPKAEGMGDGAGPVLATIGRLHHEKGQDIALGVLAAVRTDHPRAQLILVGGGALKGQLRRTAHQLGVSEAVRMVDPITQDEVFGLLKAIDVLLVPSRTEGLPAVVLEAFAAGVPVVSSAVGGVPEVVVHGRTGLLAPAGDTDELARLCVAVLADAELRAGLVRRAFERVHDFPAANLIDGRVRVYRELGQARTTALRCGR